MNRGSKIGLLRMALVLTSLVHAALALWIARDARRAGRPAVPWALATLAGGLFSVVAYIRWRG